MPMTQNEKKTATPMVGIGIPVYNGEKYIREALDSVLAQTYQDYEVIISDNASSDKTQAICVAYSKRHPRIKYFRQPKNLGPHWNFNFVAQKTRGSLFTWLAHDDVMEPHFLADSVQYFSMRPKTVLVSGDFQIIDDDGTELGIEKLEMIRDHIEWNKRCIEFFRYPISNVFLCIYGMMNSDTCKSVLQSLPGTTIAAGSELPILARFAVTGEIASIPTVLRKYRRHAASVYRSEVTKLSERPMLHRRAIRIGNRFRLRFDQMAVVLFSALPPSLKYEIAFKVLFRYMTLFIFRILRIPLKG